MKVEGQPRATRRGEMKAEFYLAILSSFILVPSSLFSQSLLPESPVSSSLSNSIVALPSQIAFALNPAQSRADSLHPLHASLAYTPFAGGLKEASQGAAEAKFYSSFISSSLAIGVTNLSYSDLYSDLAFYASFAKSFDLANNRKASAGVRLRYESLGTTPDYPKLHFLFADLGFSLDLTPEFSLGGAALNLLGTKYQIVNGEMEKLVRRFLVGIAYQPAAIPVKLLTSLEEDPNQPLAFAFGAEYDPITFLALRLGVSTDTGDITTGIGINYSNISFDVGSRFDKALGSIFSFGASGAW